MDFGTIMNDSFEYTKDGFFRNPGTWILLLILILLPVIPFVILLFLMLPSLLMGVMPDITALIGGLAVACILAVLLSAFYQGYQVKIFRGETPLPPVSGFGRMVRDGIIYMVIQILYALPVLIIIALTIGSALLAALQAGSLQDVLSPAFLASVIIGILIALVGAFVLSLIAVIGVVRFARTGRMGVAFDFRAILATIRKIGWGTYILALIIVIAAIVIVQIVLGLIPYIGPVIQFIIAPIIAVFYARYICILYDAAEGGSALPIIEVS